MFVVLGIKPRALCKWGSVVPLSHIPSLCLANVNNQWKNEEIGICGPAFFSCWFLGPVCSWSDWSFLASCSQFAAIKRWALSVLEKHSFWGIIQWLCQPCNLCSCPHLLFPNFKSLTVSASPTLVTLPQSPEFLGLTPCQVGQCVAVLYCV